MKKAIPLLVSLMAVIPVVASAGFQVVDEPADQSVHPAQGVGAKGDPQKSGGGDSFGLVAVTYIGKPDSDIEVRSGFARDVKLVDALKQIAPEGWHAYLKEEIVGKFDKNRLVSWKGGRKWTEVLDILANDNSLSIDVDWGKKTLFVGEKKFAPAVATALAKTPAKPDPWVIHSGSTVREALYDWARKAGWGVVWNLTEDWRVPADTPFEGDFKAAATQVLKDLASNGVQVQATFYNANRTLVVNGNGTEEQK